MIKIKLKYFDIYYIIQYMYLLKNNINKILYNQKNNYIIINKNI